MAENNSVNYGAIGMNLDGGAKKGELSYALNAVVDSFDGAQVSYQNEPGADFCCRFPDGYRVIGHKNILEANLTVFWLVNPATQGSEIGTLVNGTCAYQTWLNDPKLNFSLDFPVHKAVAKITNCSVEVYWTDAHNPRRFIDLNKKPLVDGVFDPNLIKVQPDYAIPALAVRAVESDGDLQAGVYQFGVQYANAAGEAYTSVHSLTNPTPIYNPHYVGLDHDYRVSRSIEVEVQGLDTKGFYDYFNLIVIKTVNDIATPYLAGTYPITETARRLVYTGQNKEELRLQMADVFEKFPIYEVADDLTTVQDVLVWKGLTTPARVNYQAIWSQVALQWETVKLPVQLGYQKEEHSTHLRGYMRDEVYPFEGCFLLRSGHQTDGFHIPGRRATALDLELVSGEDILGEDEACDDRPAALPRWKVYNTATKRGEAPGPFNNCAVSAFEWGDFAYWESTERYPDNPAVWGALAGTPIRHHKFPDSAVTHIHDEAGFVHPLGVRIDAEQLRTLIQNSALTEAQKAEIVGFKILRGNRANQKSVVARGLVNNVGLYERQGTKYFYPNYPYNDLRPDPFIAEAYTRDDSGANAHLRLQGFANEESRSRFTFHSPDTHFFQPHLGNILKLETAEYGLSRGHFVPVQDHAKYKFPSSASFAVAVAVGVVCTLIPVQGGTTFGIAGPEAGLAGFQLTQELILRAIPRKNFAYQYTSVGHYTRFKPVPNAGQKQRRLQIAAYAQSGMLSVGDVHPLNNFQRESSVYLSTLGPLAVPHQIEGVPEDKSRYTISEVQNSRITALDLDPVPVDAVPCPGPASVEVGMDLNLGVYVFSIGAAVRPGYSYTLSHSSGAYIFYMAVEGDTAATVAEKLAARSFGSLKATASYGGGVKVHVRVTEGEVLPDVSGDCADDSTYGGGYVDPTQAASCDNPGAVTATHISSFYATIKRNLVNQYGTLYSYETIDTGTQVLFAALDARRPVVSVFGGDTFINRFGLKTKMPFFIDHRVGLPDDSDVFYDDLGNVGYPVYWFSTDVKESGTDGGGGGKGLFKKIKQAMGIKVNNFDCRRNKFFYQDGKIYLFAYGIPYFYTESEVNVELRGAYNGAEGDFYPHVGGDIPDFWLQEKNVSIQRDNTFHYNRTYSKQNKENYFAHLPADYSAERCRFVLPFRAIYSEQQRDVTDYRRNNWLIYRPAAKFDFPQNYGRLVSLEGLENKAVLARFDHKSLLYNTMLRIDTSNPMAAYLGNDTLFKGAPPVDIADTALGYAGAQHKLFLKTEKGHLSCDARRGKVFLYTGTQVKEISALKATAFFQQHLPFQMEKHFPGYPCDNHFAGVGLHGTIDAVYNRLILTKLDYAPLTRDVQWDGKGFKAGNTPVTLGDPKYFANHSFTISFDFDNGGWISFHSYHPNFYVAQPHAFQSGAAEGLYTHMENVTKFNHFAGAVAPYVIEYPFAYLGPDEILQNIKDYTKVLKYDADLTYVEVDDVYFNKAILSNGQQTSGLLELVKKPKNNMQAQLQFPKYNIGSKTILYTKSDNFYNYNTFWGLVKDKTKKLFINDPATPLSFDKELNTDNLDYSKRSFKKEPLRAKELKVRHILDNTSDYKLLSQFILAPTQTSIK